jgi:hypothetical protein
MKTSRTYAMMNRLGRSGILAVMLLFPFIACANPIEIPEKPVTLEITFLIITAILIEVVCVWLILRRSQKPKFFPVWLIGMHLLTYPAFLGLLWLIQDIRPAFAVAIGEGLVVLVEGGLIYLICRLIRPANPDLAPATGMKCWLASFIGNACSAGAFPILIAACDHFIAR